MRRLVPFLVVLAGCAPKTEVLTVPPGPAPGAASPAAATISDSARFLTAIVERIPAPPNPKSVDQLEGDSSARPDDPATLKALGLAYYNAGGYLPAQTTLDRARKIKPDDAEAALYLGLSQVGQGETEAGEKTLRDVSALPSGTPSVKARAYCGLGDLAYAEKKDADAAKLYALAQKTDPTLGVAALALGALQAQAGKKPDAKVLFLSAAKNLQPGALRARAYASLGRLAQEAKNAPETKSWADKSLTDDPTNPWAKQLVGLK